MVCKNCIQTLNLEQNYCPNCGAKVIRNRLTMRNLIEHISETFFNYDNKFLKTFIHLFTKPQDVINSYIWGTRKKYINVIQYLAIALTLLGVQLFIMSTFFVDYFTPVFTEYEKQLMDEFYTEEAQEQMLQFLSGVNEYQSLIYVIGIPFTAFVTWLVFLKEHLFNFTEHIVLNIYLTAQYVLASVITYLLFALFNINIYILVTLSFIWYIIYYGFVFYKTHNIEKGTVVLRFLYTLLIFGLLFIISIIIGVIGAIIYTKFIK